MSPWSWTPAELTLTCSVLAWPAKTGREQQASEQRHGHGSTQNMTVGRSQHLDSHVDSHGDVSRSDAMASMDAHSARSRPGTTRSDGVNILQRDF